MCIKSDECLSGSHISEYISLRIDLDFIKIQFPHLFGDPFNVILFPTALTREFYDLSEKFCHIRFIVLCSFFDFVEIHFKILLDKHNEMVS